LIRMSDALTRGMTHYIAHIHEEQGSAHGVSFPDVPGVTAAADSLDDVLMKGAEALALAAEDWEHGTGAEFPRPRTLVALREDPDFGFELGEGAVVAAVPFPVHAGEAA